MITSWILVYAATLSFISLTRKAKKAYFLALPIDVNTVSLLILRGLFLYCVFGKSKAIMRMSTEITAIWTTKTTFLVTFYLAYKFLFFRPIHEHKGQHKHTSAQTSTWFTKQTNSYRIIVAHRRLNALLSICKHLWMNKLAYFHVVAHASKPQRMCLTRLLGEHTLWREPSAAGTSRLRMLYTASALRITKALIACGMQTLKLGFSYSDTREAHSLHHR